MNSVFSGHQEIVYSGYEVTEIRWQSGIENFVSERGDIFNLFRNFSPVKRFQNSSDVLQFWSLDNSSSNSILDVLATFFFEIPEEQGTGGFNSEFWSGR